MSRNSADDPSFRVGAEQNDALSVMTRLRASQAFESNEPEQLDGVVEELIDKNLNQEQPDWSEVTRKVMRGVVESITEQDEADWAIRRASHRAVLAVARRWGNVVMAGKATVVAAQEAASRAGLDSVRAVQQAGLGAIEGVLQVGPVAYPVLQGEITPMVEDLSEILAEERRSGEWMLRSLERSTIELPLLPVLPVEDVAPAEFDLAVEDYALVAVNHAVMDPSPDAGVAAIVEQINSAAEEDDSDLGNPPDLFAAAPSAVRSPEKPGWLQRVVRWFFRLIGKKD